MIKFLNEAETGGNTTKKFKCATFSKDSLVLIYEKKQLLFTINDANGKSLNHTIDEKDRKNFKECLMEIRNIETK